MLMEGYIPHGKYSMSKKRDDSVKIFLIELPTLVTLVALLKVNIYSNIPSFTLICFMVAEMCQNVKILTLPIH